MKSTCGWVAFTAVAEARSFRAAAQQLHVSQPPLSFQIANLESELGARLFHRTSRSVELSEAGRALLLWGALQVDLLRRSPDEAERQQADDLLGLITPVIKGYLTDKGFEAAVLAQQVFGQRGVVRGGEARGSEVGDHEPARPGPLPRDPPWCAPARRRGADGRARGCAIWCGL